MARCTTCHNKWKTKDMWLLGFTKKGKECLNCGTRQFLSFKNRELILGLGFLSGAIAILMIMFFPFLLTLSDQDDMTY